MRAIAFGGYASFFQRPLPIRYWSILATVGNILAFAVLIWSVWHRTAVAMRAAPDSKS